ncbi:hypothetical protein QZH41_002324 [Actinostola sp. cb2023]|nr:hypothetical protein QZH41_002324 [Actinostola sp. cb2023]
MEDEHKLIVLWTVFSGFVVAFFLWKRYKYINSQSSAQEVNETCRGVQEARLKHFKFDETVDNSEGNTNREQNTKMKDTEQIENTFRERERKGKAENVSVNEKVIVGPSFDQTEPVGRIGRHFDPDTGSPITQALKTLEEAMLWRSGYDEFNVARAMLAPGCRGLDNRPRTLVCHDMKGGYIEDSHHFVTIPPPCWTNAAHNNGVLVLGTLITEWEDGAQICNEFLEDEHSFKALANQLVDITEYYNFDGWLINIENPIQAVKAAREDKLSAAIFAPGWVLETQGEKNFTAKENKFWSLLSKDCPTHPMVAFTHPWTNLSCQQTQPSYNNAFYNLGGKGGNGYVR